MKNSYADQVKEYINSTPELDNILFEFWNTWTPVGEKIDIKAANDLFLEGMAKTPNVGRKGHLTPHCFMVARTAEALTQKVLDNTNGAF